MKNSKDILSNVYLNDDGEVAYVRNANSEIEAAIMLLTEALESGSEFIEETIPIQSCELVERCYVLENSEEAMVEFRICPDDIDEDRFFTQHELENLESIYRFKIK